MTKREISEQLTNFRTEMGSLILKINAFETALQRINEEDVLGAYKSDISEKTYWLNASGNIDRCDGLTFDDDNHPFCNYPSLEYAQQAQRIKDFNDKLLAFKWCYDRDYKPDWVDEDEAKYWIYYDSEDNRYDYDFSIFNNNTIYFSSKEIAIKCCEWLNSKED